LTKLSVDFGVSLVGGVGWVCGDSLYLKGDREKERGNSQKSPSGQTHGEKISANCVRQRDFEITPIVSSYFLFVVVVVVPLYPADLGSKRRISFTSLSTTHAARMPSTNREIHLVPFTAGDESKKDTRKRYIHNLTDLLYVCLLRGDIERAQRAWAILVS